jgi:hypothetical protein
VFWNNGWACGFNNINPQTFRPQGSGFNHPDRAVSSLSKIDWGRIIYLSRFFLLKEKGRMTSPAA